MTAVRIAEFQQANGQSPFRRWFDGLDAPAAAKVATALLRLEMGNTSSLKRIGPISECRIDWGPGYRIYLAQDGVTLIVLFGGGTKRSQSADIRRAVALFEEYEARKATAGSRK